jgi:hypothetical protein
MVSTDFWSLGMKKLTKTAAQLEDMIGERIGPGVLVKVHGDPAYGWHPTVFSAPAQVHRYQILAEHVAKELRDQFDLADGSRP